VGSVWWTVAAVNVGRPRAAGARAAEAVPLSVRRGRGDLVLLASVGILVALGIVMVFDVTYFYGQEHYGDPLRFFRRHLVAVGLGLVGLTVASRLPLVIYRRIALPALGLGLLGIAAVWSPLGIAEGGARRWLYLAGITVQPAEVLKVGAVVYLAWFLARHRDLTGDPRALLGPAALVGTAGVLLLLQPDFGTVVLLGSVFVAMIFIAGWPLGRLGVFVGVMVPLAVLVAASADYRKTRLLRFLDPWGDPRNTGFQLVQSLIAFGSGGFGGLGLGESRQKMFYLPAAHTDFIFSVVGEELGLLGALAVVVLFGIFTARGMRMSMRHVDPFGRLLAFGLTVLLALQAIVNMAVVLGLAPTKGLPLPFVSYGGSAMIMALTSAGVLYGLSREAG
jgi:cell division protein FtsW